MTSLRFTTIYTMIISLVVLFLFSSSSCVFFSSYAALQGWPVVLPPRFIPVNTTLPLFHKPPLQSPINIRTALATRAVLPDLQFEDLLSSNSVVKIINTGTTVEFEIAHNSVTKPRLKGGPLAIHGEYEFNNLHFHWGSKDFLGGEHEINSRRYAIEGHCVHFNIKYGTFEEAQKHPDGLAVVAFFGKAGQRDNPDFEPLLRFLPNIRMPNSSVAVSTKKSLCWFANLLKPANYYTYPGSLTTPPYTENVIWIVYPNPFPISSRQVNAFRNLLSTNFTVLRENTRELQDFNRRPLIFAIRNTSMLVFPQKKIQRTLFSSLCL